MSFRQTLVDRTSIARELLQFFWQTKWWWLTPLVIMLLLFAVLIVFAQTSAIAPFIYTLF